MTKKNLLNSMIQEWNNLKWSLIVSVAKRKGDPMTFI